MLPDSISAHHSLVTFLQVSVNYPLLLLLLSHTAKEQIKSEKNWQKQLRDCGVKVFKSKV